MAEGSTYSTEGEPREADGTEEFLRRMLERYDRSVTADQENRLAAIDDLRFRSGIHWPTNLQNAREQDDRPVLTINQVPQFVRQVTGDIRQNTPQIKVMPVDSGADKDKAEIYNGLIRNIEQASHSKYVYSQGADQSVTAGFGAWRLVTDYTDDDSFEQDIRIKSIPNALSVVWDPLAIELNKSDANFCFVHYRLPKSEFKDQWPKATIIDFEIRSDDVDAQALRSWFDGEGVRVAEYWCKEPCTKKIAKLQTGEVIDCTDLDTETLMQLGPVMNGMKPLVREVKSHKIVQYIVSGREVLDGPNPWAGKYIPIIHVPGEEVWVGENRVTHGLVRFLKDPSRLVNYMRSCSAEVVGQQPKMPWILTPGMIGGYEQDWANSGKSGKPYLLWNPDPEFPGIKPERSQPPVPATGLAQEAAMAMEDMHRVTGIYPSSLGQRSNEASGKAILAREQQGDTGTFVYIDNVAMAIAHTGEQLVDLIPRIYDTDRVVRILGEDGSHNMVPINRELVVKGLNGVDKVIKFDLTVGKYDVVVATGPNFQTRRQEAGQGLLTFIQALPESGPLLADIVADVQDWPRADEVKERMQTLLPPQFQPPQLGPDGQPLPPPEPPPDPKVVEMQQKTELAQKQFDLDTQQAQHEAQLAESKARQEAQLAAFKAESDVKLKWWIAQQDVKLEASKSAAQAKIADRSAQQKVDRENAPPMPSLDGMREMLAELHEKVAKPKRKQVRVWRDPNTDEVQGEVTEVPDEPDPLSLMPMPDEMQPMFEEGAMPQ